MTRGSRINKCEMCFARKSSIPKGYISDKRIERKVGCPDRGHKGAWKFPRHMVPRYHCTLAGSANCRRCTTKQSRSEILGYGICRSLRASDDVRTASGHSILRKPSSRAPLQYGHPRLRRRRSIERPHRQCSPSTGGSRRSAPTKKIAQVKKCKRGSYKGATNKYRSERDEGVVYPPRLGHATRLECQLKTTASHSEAHSIHVNVILQCGSILSLWKRNT